MKLPKMSFRKPSFKTILRGVLVLTLIGLIAFVGSQFQVWQARAAATIYWDGGGDGTSWSNALNWNTDVVPVAADEVLIDTNSTVIINTPITVKSLVLGKAAGTATSTLQFAYDAISLGALTITDGDLIIYYGASITHSPAVGSVAIGKININVQAGNAQIIGNLTADSKGYPYNQGIGKGYNSDGGASGASHAGIGGRGNGTASVSGTYGSYNNPVDLGSGGGRHSSSAGPNGGGAIKITVAGTTTVNGNLTADGAYGNGYSDRADGGGAGGSIWLTTGTLAGSGNIKANGGNSRDTGYDGGGGGGGRIAIFYGTNSATLATLSAKGGTTGGGGQHGGAGSIYTKANTATNGDLLISNQEAAWSGGYGIPLTPLPDNLTVDNITLTKFAAVNYDSTITAVDSMTISYSTEFRISGTINANTLYVSNGGWLFSESTATTTYSTLNWTGGYIRDNGGVLALVSGGGALTIPATSRLEGNVPRSFTNVTVDGVLTHTANWDLEVYKINYTISGNLIVNGQINVDGRGYGYTLGPGKGYNTDGGASGASHAGTGGRGNGTGSVSGTYGDYLQPITLGSGGGRHSSSGAPYGGGAIKLTVTGTTTVNGTISASGAYGNGYSDRADGGGAGGSIWIITDTLTGTGTVRADGGDSRDTGYDGGGGGGGRIALYYTTNTSNFTSLTAGGGTVGGGGQHGGAGTIYKKQASAVNGDLIVDNVEAAWAGGYGIPLTNLVNSLTIDNLTVTRFARVEYSSTLNVVGTTTISYSSEYRMVGTMSTNVLNLTNGAWFLSESTATTTYSTLNWTGGYIRDNGGVLALVSGGGALTIPATSRLEGNVPRSFTNVTVDGVLTHTANWDLEVYKINYTISGNLVVNGQINVDGRGYGYTLGPGKGYNTDGGASGASHAGTGGRGNGTGSVSGTYGDYLQPITLGSGGGRHSSSGAPYGGGAIKLTVTGTTTVNGTISASGAYGNGYSDRADGGGAGGSIWIITDTLTGTGTVRADGGDSRDTGYDGGGGGGGRIALYYTTNTSNFTSLTAGGGTVGGGGQHGGAGTIYKKQASAVNGDLIVDNVEAAWAGGYGIPLTNLVNSLTIDNLTVTRFARVEYSSTLNIVNTTTVSYSAEFRIIGTLSTNVFNLTNSATYYNELTASTIYSSYNWVGGNLYDNGGAMDLVSGGGDLTIPQTTTLIANVPRTFTNITVNGVLTHSYNGSEALYRINYTSLGFLNVTSTGQINVDSRGYATGQGPGKGNSSDAGAGGASHAGTGGNGQSGALGGIVIYGDQLAPEWLGSGAGRHSSSGGAAGGGAIKLTVGGTTTINGTVTAGGQYGNGYSDRADGGGAGGSIWIITDTIQGTGDVRANGGSTRNTSYDGGSGGGGRIAIYYAVNNSTFSTLTVNPGTNGGSAQSGTIGTIFLGGKSADPINLRQFKQDGTTGIGENGTTNETSMILTFQVQDGNTSDVLTPQVEFIPIGTNFNNVPTNTGEAVTYNGTAVTAQVPITGLADGSSYHWQARACDATNLCSNWVSFGNNTEAEPDIRVTMNADPNSPTIPESSFYINGQYTNDLQPTLGFVLSDPNNTDSVKYEIEVSNEEDFSTTILSYRSALLAQGTQLFTIGQIAGDGEYIFGEENQELTTGDYYWRVKAIDDKGGESDWTVAPGTPSFKIDLSRPTNATEMTMKAHLNAVHEYTEEDEDVWFKRNDLFFSWTDGSDTQGVKGYCVYLGTEIDGDPATEKGLLGTSPISTSGTTCQFITDETEIDFSNSALRSYDWLTSSNDKYYFKVKTIDVANNTFEGPDETNFISFLFDNTAPQNVTAVSAPSITFSSTADMYFTWPTGFTQGASDAHSQVLGFQYALNSKDTWWGDTLDEITGLSYSAMDTEQPLFFPQEVRSLVQLGQNTIYFRIVDRAGNYSELRTAFINYGGEAPKFAQGEEITVTPRQNTINRYAFSWPDAIPSEGNTVDTYYYMINTPPPVSYATITSNSATYIATENTSLPEASLSGLRKGANTIYVAVVDEVGNYSPTNVLSATFYLNSELPDSPLDVAVADISIKDVSIWRAAVVWSEPEYKGTGNLTYHVYRSEDGETWEKIATTTGLTYIDVVAESKTYFWKVASTDNSDESIAEPSMSNAVSLIPRGKYLVPADLTSGPATSSITTTKATVSWTTSRTCDSKVAFGLASGNYFEEESYNSTHLTEHKINLNNLDPGTTYYYVTRWTDEDGNTGESEEMSFTTEPAPEVRNVRISNIGISGAIINFTTIKASSVKVYYGPTVAYGGVKEIATSKLETTYALELDKLDDGTKYYYKINTLDAEGKEYEGTTLDFTTLPRPRVYNIKIQQVAKTAQSTLFVTWDSNTSVSSIVTYYPETNPELMRDNVEIALKDGQHEMLIKGLFPDTVYVVQVRGKDIIGNEAVSDTIRITTSADSRAPQISTMILEGSNVTTADGGVSSQLVISWNTDEPSTSQVEYGEGSGEDYNQLTQEDQDLSYNHVVIISGLTPSKVYHLRAISKDSAGNVSKSVDTVTITPKATDNAFYLVVTTLKEAFGFLENL